jgi:hypothetical protein
LVLHRLGECLSTFEKVEGLYVVVEQEGAEVGVCVENVSMLEVGTNGLESMEDAGVAKGGGKLIGSGEEVLTASRSSKPTPLTYVTR